MTKGAGSQGIQNGSVSCIGVTASVPSGIREVMGENLVAALLGLECASSNDQSFSNSDMRRTARTMLQFLPGTDFIFSGYAGEPNYDNMFAVQTLTRRILTITTCSREICRWTAASAR